ncbi:uncharacterized protein DUF2029 [Isoptericola jiangsuensis]|uniref:Uncharacterized protein DUF2029 n=1 Tax=Isoptericola jiangsuensis TaxID=548579 RepID=A0A2A9F199_9MICO|nr:glycosyltransferase family 87 protein [Isoptericola jiangsuensis]PFG44235.1 uncharacterized protein DUF2029 [Isoptericola jiangsuensis]
MTWGSARVRGLVAAGLWVVVVLGTAFLVVERYCGAVGDPTSGMDLGFFLEGADAVDSAGTPYAAPMYVYSPLLALALGPVSGGASAQMAWWTAMSLGAGLGAVALVVASVWRDLGTWSRPLVSGVAALTLLASWPVVVVLWLGQVDLLLLALMALAVLLVVRGRPTAGAFVVGLAAALKTWAGGLALWGFRRGGDARATLVGVGAALALTVVVSTVAVGPDAVPRWVGRTLAASDQPLTSYSAWGAGRDLFTSSGVLARPVVESAALGVVVTVVLAAWAVALLVVALRRPGDPRLSAWNVMACLLLLMPVSHLAYRVLALPLLWVWPALARRVGRTSWVVLLVTLAGCWLVGYRLVPGDPGSVDVGLYLAVLGAAYVSTTASTLLAARLAPARCDDVEVSSPQPGRVQ